ncbi:MAG: M12 family metallo-peptidase [Phycisphaerales bacterium]
MDRMRFGVTTRRLTGVLAGGAVALGWAGLAAGQARSSADGRGLSGWTESAGEVAAVFAPVSVSNRATISAYATPLDVDFDAIDRLGAHERVHMVGLPLSRTELIDLDLERVRVLDENAELFHGTTRLERPAQPMNVMFEGEVAGEPGSWAYLSFSRFGVRGIVEIDGVTHVISSGDPREGINPVVYDLTRLPEGEINWVEWACSAIDPNTGLPTDGLPDQLVGQAGDGGDEGEGDPCRVVNVAIEADAEFGERYTGENAVEAHNAYIESLVGAVNVIYRRNVNVRLNIVYIRSWVGAPEDADPWDGTSTFARLLELRQTWQPGAAPTQLDWQSAHMFSSARLGGGVAYLNAICNLNIAHAVSADMTGFFPTTEVTPGSPEPIDNNGQNWDVVVTAHEWGHNFGAPHTHGLAPVVDGCGLGDCSLSEFGTIMSYCHTCPGGLQNIELNFAARILDEGIRPYLEFGAPCDLVETSDACEAPNEVCIADVNQDNQLTPQDFVAWIIAYNAGDLIADSNRDGELTPQDFNAWLAAYNLGCDFD